MEMLLNFLSNKTDKIKSVVDLEEKVRQDMVKSTVVAKKATVPFSRGTGRTDDVG